MKNILYLLIVFSLVTFSCDVEKITENQAGEFIKFYTNYPEFLAADVAVTEDGYAVLGTAKISGEESWICFIRTDEYGNSVDTARLYGLNSGSIANTANCIKSLEDGGFGILGSVLNENTGYRSAYFVRTDGKGDTLFTRTISLNGDLEARYFDVSNDGSFYMTGYFNEPGKGHQMWWFGIDNQGNDIRNQRTAGFDGDDECTHLVILPDGGLLLSGFIGTSSGTKSYIIRTTENTVALKNMEIPSSVNEKGECVLPLNDNTCLLLATSGNTSTTQITLKRIDLAASHPENYILWEKSYGSTSPEMSKSLIMDDQFIYILGTSMINSSNTLITLLKTDLSGNEVDRINFGSGSKLLPAAFKKTGDGGLIISGTNSNPEANNTSIALIKTR